MFMKWIVAIFCPCLLFAELDYTFDEEGKLKSIRSEDGTLAYMYEYDANGTMSSVRDLVQGTTAYRTSEETLVDIFPENFPMLRQEGIQYIYDPLERVSEAFIPEKFRFVFAYDGFNRCISHSYYEWKEGSWLLKSRNGYSNLWQLIGTALQQYCYHTIPFRGVRDAGIYIGEWLGAVPIPEEDKICCIGSVGEKQSNANRVHLLINGLNTNLRDTISFSSFISEAFDNEKVIYAYNATHGVIPDTWEYISQKLYFETPSFQICLEALKKALSEVKADGTVIIWAHSLGGLILERVLARISSAEKKKLQIFTFGSSAFFSKDEMKEVRHIVSPRDLIPLIGDPLRYFLAPLWDSNLIQVIPAADGWTLANHAFMGPAYQKEILRIAASFKN